MEKLRHSLAGLEIEMGHFDIFSRDASDALREGTLIVRVCASVTVVFSHVSVFARASVCML